MRENTDQNNSKYGHSSRSANHCNICDAKGNSSVDTQKILQCFGTSIKVIAEVKYDTFFFAFMILLMKKIASKLNFMIAGGKGRKDLLEF